MADYKNVPLGLRTQTQIPLDVKEYVQNESLLSNLGVNGQLAYTYTKGLVVYCIEESTRWEWTEVKPGLEDTGLINQDFIYPDNHIAFGIDYSNKRYNFVKVTSGSETKINAGTNVTVTGNGTTATPYIINSSGGASVNDATSSIKGILRLTGDLGGTADAPTTPTAVHKTGDETISGYKSFLNLLDLTGAISGIGFNTSTSWTTNYAFPMLTRTGSLLTLRGSASGASTRYGSMFDNNLLTTVDRTFTFPDKNGIFALTSDLNLQRVITTSTVILDSDNNHTIFINNGTTPITITIDSSITLPNFCVGFVQEGTGDVTFVGSGVSLTNPVGLKSKGQGYATFIERKLNTSTYYLLGNVKS